MHAGCATLGAVQIHVTPLRDFAALEQEWRSLEARLPALSFFQSWTWIGCLAEERYPNAVLLRLETEGRVLGLALFNRHQGRLSLAGSADAALDAPFIEHNAPLLLPEAGEEGLRLMLRAAWATAGTRRLLLDGVSPAILAAAGGTPLRLQERIAPFIALDTLRGHGTYLDSRSANTRQQLRRSLRAYATRGPLVLARAGDTAEAQSWLAALITLHEATWQARGAPGAFATPYLRRFHAALVARAMARDELEMLRVTSGRDIVGYLYNFRLRGRVSAYQSGLDHACAGPQEKPGLTCHLLAIERALAAGDSVYDFLAGADRYKRSLATAEAPLLWAELLRPWSPLGLAARLRATALQWHARLRADGGNHA